MFQKPRSIMRVAAPYQSIFRELGIDADGVFNHPLIKPWRMLDDRENCTLQTTLRDGRSIKWHVKRYKPAYGFTTPADDEVKGHAALMVEEIPTVELIGWGKLMSRHSFVIMDDLSGYQPADKLIESGTNFDRLLAPLADMAARLHRVGLHHRDLYLCHFFVKLNDGSVDVRLIDTARVSRLPGIFTRARWIAKDLAQFWYSTLKLPITDGQRQKWLDRYTEQRGLPGSAQLRAKIDRKVAWIGKHDEQLRRQQPNRNISIPVK